MSTPDTAALRLLLLHRLREAEAQQLEERLMLDEQLGDLLREAEHDLLDDYASGGLLPEERMAVERYLLATPEDRERLKVARALAHLQGRPEGGRSGQDHTSVIPPGAASEIRSPTALRGRSRGWPLRIGLAAAACTILAVGMLFFRLKMGGNLPVSATVVLLADAQRGSSEGTINISPKVERVRLQVETPSQGRAPTYTIAIADRGGRLLYEAHDLPPRQAGSYPFVEAIVPASALEGPRCRITLTDASVGSASSGLVFTWDIQIQRH